MPRAERVRDDETFDQFARRFGIDAQTLISLNQQDGSPLQGKLPTAPALTRRNWLMGERNLDLFVPDDAVGGAAVVVGPAEPPACPEPLAPMVNDGYHWLTFETLFNQRPYRKTNQALKLGLYKIPLKRVKVWLRDDVAADLVDRLHKAFFPDLPNKEAIQRISDTLWVWKKKTADKMSAFLLTGTPPKSLASRDQTKVYLMRNVVMPFNFADNGEASHAIGREATTAHGAELEKLKPEWRFWKTASRSLLVDLQPVVKPNKSWNKIVVKPFGWTLATLPAVNPARVGQFERQTDLIVVRNGGTQFNFQALPTVLGVKTGVQFVGWSDQQGVHKDRLEENSIIACLRSDLIAEMNRELGIGNPAADPDIVIQTELLSITEVDPTGTQEFCDGIQVRDFSVLNPAKLYFPPISIPFVALDLKTMQRRFAAVEDPNWSNFWKQHYAVRLGQAKAKLLLRYGLQMGSPNAQNMLIEFNPPANPMAAPTPTGRIVFRDVGDMYLHREVLWARLGGAGLPPQGRGDGIRLRTLRSPVIRYECDVLKVGSAAENWREYVPYETGNLYEIQYGPPGTRFLWFRFSTLSKGTNVAAPSAMGTDPDAYSQGWRAVLEAMCAWGVAHNRAYVSYLENKLGLNLSLDDAAQPDPADRINWARAPNPADYRALPPDGRDAAGIMHNDNQRWEDAAAAKVHAVLASAAGQAAIQRARV
ncbi:MAG: hypothetical protein QOI94_191 [Acidobacteriaceae bacterium]|nr:hypothetical protein [Acidobacteriaceae bacterium]